MANLENPQGKDLSSEEMRGDLMQRLARDSRLQAAVLALTMSISGAIVRQGEASAQETSVMSLDRDTFMLKSGEVKTISIPSRGRTFTVNCHKDCSPTFVATEGLDVRHSQLGPNSFSFIIKFKPDAKGSQSVTIDIGGKKTTLKVVKAQPSEPLVSEKQFTEKFRQMEEALKALGKELKQQIRDEAEKAAKETEDVLEAAQYYLTAPQLKDLEGTALMVKNSLQAADGALNRLADQIEDKNLLKATQESLSSAIKALDNLQTVVDALKKDKKHQLTPELRQALLKAAQESLSSAVKALDNLQAAVDALKKDKKYQSMNPELRQALLKAAQESLQTATTAFEALTITIQRIGGYVTAPRVWDIEQTLEKARKDLQDAKDRLEAVEDQLAENPVNEVGLTAGVVGANGQTGFEADVQYKRTVVDAGVFKLKVKGGLGVEGIDLPVKGIPGETTHSMDYFAVAGLEQEIQGVRNWLSIVLSEEIEAGVQQRLSRPFADASLKGGYDGFVGGAFTGGLETGFGSKNFRLGIKGGTEISNKRTEALGDRGDPAIRWRAGAYLGGKF